MSYETPTNAFLNIFALDQQVKEAIKAQERYAAQSILEAQKSKIKAHGTTLSTKLEHEKEKMKNFAGKTVPSNFKEGLTGKAAEAAEKMLQSKKFDPDLKSPLQS